MPETHKSPAVVQVMRWDGTAEGASRIIDWILGSGGTAIYTCSDPVRCSEHNGDTPHSIKILSSQGDRIASLGDWIVRDIRGEFHPAVEYPGA